MKRVRCVRCNEEPDYCAECVRELHPYPPGLAEEAIRRLSEIDPEFQSKVETSYRRIYERIPASVRLVPA